MTAVPESPGLAGVHRAWLDGTLVALVATVVVVAFHDMFWWAPDEAVYGYVAERLLAGDVLHRDVQDVHAGYIHFLHAGAFALFGVDLLSLRYPLAAVTVVQAAMIWAVMLPIGRPIALAGGLAMAALTFVQFLNPSANWYTLFFAVCCVFVIDRVPPGTRGRVEILGALVVTAFLFRQLSGVFVAMGVVTWLLAEASRPGSEGRGWLGRLVLLTTAAGLAGYLAGKPGIVNWLVFGAWPMALLLWAAWSCRVPERTALVILARLGVGGALALAPLVFYHAIHGSLWAWFDDSVLAAMHLSQMTFIEGRSYMQMVGLAIAAVTRGGDVAALASGLFWIALFLLPIGVGARVLLLARSKGLAGLHPLPVMAVFHSMVAVHFAIPMYLLFTAGLNVAAWLLLAAPHRRLAAISLALAASVAAAGLATQAGEPIDRKMKGIMFGRHMAQDATGLPRASLRIRQEDQAHYRDIVALVDRFSGPEDTVLATPIRPEVNFLSGRRSPYRYYSPALGLRDESDLAAALAQLDSAPPKLVFYRPHHFYETPLTARLMRAITQRYEWIASVGELEVYLHAGPAAAQPVRR